MCRYLPNARITLFTYRGGLAGKTSLLTPQWFCSSAKSLLDDIKNRLGPLNNPVAITAHSLGGVIAKKALLLKEADEFGLKRNLRCLVFFGTPHRCPGTRSSWEDHVLNIIFTNPSSSPFFRNGSTRVHDLAQDMGQVSGEFSLIAKPTLVCIHQQCDHDSPTVSKYAATFGLVSEVIISSERDHRSLMDFECSDDGDREVKLIAEILQKNCDAVYTKTLSRLSSISPSSTRILLHDEGGFTSNEQPEYQRWKDSPYFSTLHLKLDQSKGDAEGSTALFRQLQFERQIVAYHRFDESDNRSKSTHSVLASLILQLLEQNPRKFDHVAQLCGSMAKREAWTEQSLTVLFRLLITRAEEPKTEMFLVIDGYHPSLLVIFNVFGNISCYKERPVAWKVALFASNNDCIERTLSNFGESAYYTVRTTWPQISHTRSKALTEQVFVKKPYLQKLEEDIGRIISASESSAQLEVNMYKLTTLETMQLWTSTALASELSSLPYNVESFVFAMVETLPNWAKSLLGWVIHAQRRLQLTELSAIMNICTTGEELDRDDMIFNTSAAMASALGPLIRITGNEVSVSHDSIRDCLLQSFRSTQQQTFSDVHEDRHDDKGSIAELGTRTASESPTKGGLDAPCSPHIAIQSRDNSCLQTGIPDDEAISIFLLKYLTSKSLQEACERLSKSEWLDLPQDSILRLACYAVSFWPFHYRIAEDTGCDIRPFLRFLKDESLVKNWLSLSLILGGTEIPPQRTILANSLHLACLLGFPSLAKELKPEYDDHDSWGIAVALASWGGHQCILKDLLAEGRGPMNLKTALDYASVRGHDEIMEVLIRHATELDYGLLYEDEVFCQAAELGFVNQLDLILKGGYEDIDRTSEDSTALQLAAKNEHSNVVSFLLEKGADPDSRDAADAMKPILHASKNADIASLRLFLGKGADRLVKSELSQTALHLSATGAQTEIVRMILDEAEVSGIREPEDGKTHHRGDRQQDELLTVNMAGKPTKTDQALPPPIDDASNPEGLPLVKRTPGVNDCDINGMTPLMLASKSGGLAVVRILPDRGALVDLVDKAYHTALYYAVSHGHRGIAQLILKYTDLGKPLQDGPKVIVEAARAGFVEVIDNCLQAGSTCVEGHENEQKSTALHLAAGLGNGDVVSLLLSKDFAVDERDDENRTSLELAGMAGKPEIVSLLLDYGADASVEDDSGKSIVARVANQSGIQSSSEHALVVEMLLNRGRFGLEEHDEDDRSALHYAAWKGNWKIVSVLLRHGADPSEKGCWVWNDRRWFQPYLSDMDHGEYMETVMKPFDQPPTSNDDAAVRHVLDIHSMINRRLDSLEPETPPFYTTRPLFRAFFIAIPGRNWVAALLWKTSRL
ncbi:ankyrin repeat-containing protein [Fusarium bulbicola]|nr:ankyrin repeat-containing protein [Fusarium bulbicola]